MPPIGTAVDGVTVYYLAGPQCRLSQASMNEPCEMKGIEHVMGF